MTEQPSVMAGGAAISLLLLARARFHLERAPSSGELWDELEYLAGTVDSPAAGRGALEENNQDKE